MDIEKLETAEKPEPTIKNPVGMFTDKISPTLKIIYKHYIEPIIRKNIEGYQEIIPATENHGSWILGAQPTEYIIKKLREKYDRQVYIVSMLTAGEQIIKKPNEDIVKINRRAWFDHTDLRPETGKNETVVGMKKFQINIFEEFKKSNITIYCHCMAGRSRSATETYVILYEHPEIFSDIDNWPEKNKKDISLELQARLKNNPSFGDITEFVEIRRPNVKPLAELDGDQAGLIGLIALDKAAEEGKKSEAGIFKKRSEDQLYRDVRDIGLMLKSPFDSAFRAPEDKKAQEENLVDAFQAFKDKGINLMLAMLVPQDVLGGLKHQNFLNDYFLKLTPSEQGRYAILLKQLEDKFPASQNKGDADPLEFLRNESSEFVKVAAEQADKLTSGDQVELLRTFGEITGVTYEEVIKKIQSGEGKVDGYNPGIQLAELYAVAAKKGKAAVLASIKTALMCAEENGHTK